MFTRRTATVTISAPDAACACAITGCEEYLPLPMIRRERNARPAIVKAVSETKLAPTDKIDDLHFVAVAHDRVGERVAPDDVQVVFDGHAPRIDLQTREELVDRQRVFQRI